MYSSEKLFHAVVDVLNEKWKECFWISYLFSKYHDDASAPFLPGRGGMLATTLATAEEAESLDIFLYYYL